jgi:hypothetical protein
MVMDAGSSPPEGDAPVRSDVGVKPKAKRERNDVEGKNFPKE